MGTPLVLATSVFSLVGGQLPPSPPTSAPVPPSSRDPDWMRPFEQADLLYHPGPRPDFEALRPVENCTARGCGPSGCDGKSQCTALWWPGLGNGFLGSIAQGPTLRISGFYSGDYGRYSAYKGDQVPRVPGEWSNRQNAYRASIPAFASSIVVHGPNVLANSSRAALNTREAVYYERSSVAGGGELELRTFIHQTRRNLIVVELELDCTACTESATVSLRAYSRPELSDVVFQTHGAASFTAEPAPRRLMGLLRAPEDCQPSNAHVYDTNHTLGYVHDICPEQLVAKPGRKARVQLLSVLTLSNEERAETVDTASAAGGGDPKEAVVTRAVALYKAAKVLPPDQLLDEHRQGWAALWDAGGIELDTDDLSLQQTTNATFYYLLMSTRPDWLHATLIPSTIAASGPYPHGYFGMGFWDQDTFQAPPLMCFFPPIAKNLLQNRLYQLPAYRINAKAYGLKGAYVPWEIGSTGGFSRDDGCDHQEIHIAPDVSLFIKQYYQLTQNTSSLEELFPLLEGVADFLVSRVNRTDEQGWLSIETIVGADESTGRATIDNDMFTNACSVFALEAALDAADTLGDRVSITQEQRSSWCHAAAKIKLQLAVFDGKLVHKEYDEYTFASTFIDNNTQHPSIGQGDSVLLGFPLQFNDSHRVWAGQKQQVRLNDILYYGPHVSPTGSYMTAGHYAIAWLEKPHRDLANASAWFAKGRLKNYAPWRIWSEHDSSDGGAVNFITAGGVYLQSLVFGYGGIRFHNRGMRLDPLLPPGCRSMKLRGLNFANAEFDVLVEGPGLARFSRRQSGLMEDFSSSDLQSSAAVVVKQMNGAYWLTQQHEHGKTAHVDKTDDETTVRVAGPDSINDRSVPTYLYNASSERHEPSKSLLRPCDIFAKAGTPCVAAHSSTRALYGAYAGALYQLVKGTGLGGSGLSSGNPMVTKDIKVVTAGGVVDAAAHDSFCGPEGACTVLRIYDQSPHGNHLGIQHGTPNLEAPRNGTDAGVNFTDPQSKITLGGKPAYGLFFVGDDSHNMHYVGQGYSNRTARGTSVGDEPQTTYALFSGRRYNGNCCFDYGNAENLTADGNINMANESAADGTMETVYFGAYNAPQGVGSGSGPWIGADMENGVYYSGAGEANKQANVTVPSLNLSDFVVGFVKGEPGNHYAIKAGDPGTNTLKTVYDGRRPKGYEIMKKNGGIILGTGGDNSPWAAGTFYEGAMTRGFATNETEEAIFANLVAAGYGQ